MTLLLLFQPAQQAEEDIVVVADPEIIPPIPLDVVGIIVGPAGVGDHRRNEVKWPAGWERR